VGKASSAKKVARLAEKGKGKKVRFQGGSIFPAVVLGVSLVGLGLIVYARSDVQTTTSPPTVNDHWHVSYGFYLCDEFLPNLTGNKESPLDDEYLKYGVHSHDDGVIHWHPQSAATGDKAKLGVFFDVYDIEISDSKLQFPDDQGGAVWEEGVTKCGDEDGQLKVVVWDSYDDPGSNQTYITGFDDIRIKNDGMAVTIAFVPEGTDVPMPPTASRLPELGAADTLATTTTTATPTTAAGTQTTVAGSTTTTGATAGTTTTAP
jgi:hypothetical protein